MCVCVNTFSHLYKEYGVELWERLGAPKDKILVGLATYGRSFNLEDPKVHGMNAPVIGGGTEGPYTRENGFLAYYEVSCCSGTR